MTTKITPIEEVKGALVKMEAQFQMVLPPQIPSERFIRVAQTAIQMNPSLLECTRQSLYSACMKSATDGLIPDGREAALVPFKGTCQYMPMTAGILKKIRNSGELVSIGAHIVYAGDEFEYWIDDSGEHIKHVPAFGGERVEPKLAYAIAKTRDGGVYIEVMTYKQIEAVRAVSRAKDSGPWVTWWTEMAKKTVIRRLAKRLPMSTDIEGMFERDNENYDFHPNETEKPKPERKSRMESIVTEVMSEESHAIEAAPIETAVAEHTGTTGHTETKSKDYKYLTAMQSIKTVIGDEWYYKILKEVGGVAHCNEITETAKQKQVYNEMKKFVAAKKEVDDMEAARLADEVNKGDII